MDTNIPFKLEIDIRIRPCSAPAGSRLLIRGNRHLADSMLREITILEWAPSGKNVKYRTQYGGELWADECEYLHWVIVEKLPAPSGLTLIPSMASGPFHMKFHMKSIEEVEKFFGPYIPIFTAKEVTLGTCNTDRAEDGTPSDRDSEDSG